MKRDHYRIYFFETETGFPKQVELFAGSFAEAKLLFGKKIKGTFTIQNMTTGKQKKFTIK